MYVSSSQKLHGPWTRTGDLLHFGNLTPSLQPYPLVLVDPLSQTEAESECFSGQLFESGYHPYSELQGP